MTREMLSGAFVLTGLVVLFVKKIHRIRNNTFCIIIGCQDANTHHLRKNKLCSIGNHTCPVPCPYLQAYTSPDGISLTYGASAIRIAAALAKSKYNRGIKGVIRRLFRR